MWAGRMCVYRVLAGVGALKFANMFFRKENRRMNSSHDSNAGQAPAAVPNVATLSRAQRFGAGRIATAVPAGVDAAAVASVGVAVQAQHQDEVIGLLERVRKVNDSFSIGTVYSDERKQVSVVGAGLRDLIEGTEYVFRGRIKNHPTYGEQFEVVVALPHLRPDRKSIVKYIARSFKGVGPVTAENFIKHRLEGAQDKAAALEEIRKQLLGAPWTLDFGVVNKKAKFKGSEEPSAALAFVQRDLATRLGGMPGMREKVLQALAKYLLALHESGNSEGQAQGIDPQIVQKCWASLVQDPYEPTKVVPGYAFSTADAIGASVNIPRDAPVRLKALVAHALEQGCQRAGHSYLDRDQLGTTLQRLDARAPVDVAIEYGLKAEMIVCEKLRGQERFYPPKIHDAEVELAAGLAELCRDSTPLSPKSRDALAEQVQAAAKEMGLVNGLDSSQVDALVGIMTSRSRVHTLTAGPGCGKTQLMEILAKVLEHKDFIFCGPTGKSAKVLTNRLSKLNLEANTIHSTLMGAGRGSFRYNASNKLDCDVLVNDEASMNDVELAEAVVSTVDSNAHLIIMGDDQQLPSIGPGSFLRDLLAIKQADHHRLTKTHRNSGGLLDVINQVRAGSIDCQDRAGVTFSHGLGAAAQQFADVAARYVNAVSRYGFENTVLLMAMRTGDVNVAEWNTTYANAVLRELCNPNALKVPGTRFFVGDRIIVRDNIMLSAIGPGAPVNVKRKSSSRHDEFEDTDEDESLVRVVNGDTGSILSFDREEGRSLGAKSLRLKLDDGRIVELPANSIEVLQHSYAMTVHSAQGSEYKKVIMVLTGGHPSFINQPMLLTGLSRAREELDVFADDEVLRRTARTPLPHRQSALVERVLKELRGEVDDADTEKDEVAHASPASAWSSRSAPAAGPVPQPTQSTASAASRSARFSSARVPVAQQPEPIQSRARTFMAPVSGRAEPDPYRNLDLRARWAMRPQ